jgi:hypothetical protein
MTTKEGFEYGKMATEKSIKKISDEITYWNFEENGEITLEKLSDVIPMGKKTIKKYFPYFADEISKINLNKTTIVRPKDKQKEVKKTLTKEENEFCVVIKYPNISNNLRITYDNKKNQKIVEIEEIDSNEVPVCSCKFIGKKAVGINCEYSIVCIKNRLTNIKINDLLNSTFFVDQYYKIH